MSEAAFRRRLTDGEPLTGVFVKTPSHQVIELVAATSDVDVVVIDTEHAPIGPTELDAMLAIAHALDLPCLVRVTEPSRGPIQQALDGGATGVVVPHVDAPELAACIVRWSRYGPGGRGYSGSTRSAGWGARPMAEVLRDAAAATIVVVQVEDASGLAVVDDLVAVDGIDAVFVGAADLAVSLGCDEVDQPTVVAAVDAVLAAAHRTGRSTVAYAASAEDAEQWRARGVGLVCLGSDQSRLRRSISQGVR